MFSRFFLARYFLLIATVVCINCAPGSKVFKASVSPDGAKEGIIRQYYLNPLQYPVPVYPKYSFGIRYGDRYQELYKSRDKELLLAFVDIFWSNDSQKVGFLIKTDNIGDIRAAYDVQNLKEVPFADIAPAIREGMNKRFGHLIPQGTDPLSLALGPTSIFRKVLYK